MTEVPKRRLAAYLDGELTDEARKQLESELEDSPELRAELERQRAAKADLRETPAEVPGEDVSRSAMAEIRSRKRDKQSLRDKLVKYAMGVAAVFGLGATLFSLMPQPDTTRQAVKSDSPSAAETALVHENAPDDIYLKLDEAVRRAESETQNLKQTVLSLHAISRANWETQRRAAELSDLFHDEDENDLVKRASQTDSR